MLDQVRGHASERKLRLLAVACASPLLENVRILEAALAGMVAAAERFADGFIDASEVSRIFPERGRLGLLDMPWYYDLDVVGQRTCEAIALLGWSPSEEPRWDLDFDSPDPVPPYIQVPWQPGEYAVDRTHQALTCAAQAWALFASGAPYLNRPETYGPWHETSGVPQSYYRLEKERHAWMADVCRDVFGNPFQHVALDPAWLRWNSGTVPAIARHIYDDRAFADLPLLADALKDAGCENAEVVAHCRSDGPHVRGC
jgi:hypothetical protein